MPVVFNPTGPDCMKNPIQLALLLFCLLGSIGLLSAQQTGHRCGTPDREETPEFQAQSDAMMQKILHLRNAYANKKSEAEHPNGSEYIIPIVVHVIYGDGDRKADSISYEQVASQFIELFNDFRNVPGTRGYSGMGVDTKIEFSLATKRPDGTPFSGINYYKSNTYVNFNRPQHNDIVKQGFAKQWDPEKYMNIWLVNRITDSNPGDQLGGYANFPDDRVVDDGCVILNGKWGTSGTSTSYDATATHELGHIMNIYHTFQGGCGTSLCLSSGDRVCDTPPVGDLIYKDPSRRLKSCIGGNPDVSERPRNYMDYTSPVGLCNAFSPGQAERMWACLSPDDQPAFPHRYRLHEEANIEATGAGKYSTTIKANFAADRSSSCAGAPVEFLDYSMGQPQTFLWTFQGGTPATSTQPNPTVTWATPGSYSVTLAISNLSGSTATVTKSNFITILPQSVEMPFNYNFDGAQSNIENIWTIENHDAGTMSPVMTWQRNARTNGYAATGTQTGCISMGYYSYSKYFEEDGLISPQINRTGIDSVALIFDYSYTNFIYQDKTPKPQPGSSSSTRFASAFTYSDTLDVLISTNCGASWTSVWRKGGDELRTTRRAERSNDFGEGGEHTAATAEDWDTERIDLTVPLGGENGFLVKFNGKGGFGNNLYIDNVSIRDTNVFIVSRHNWASAFERDLNVAPNPAVGKTFVSFTQPRAASLSWSLYDLTGRKVREAAPQNYPAGPNQIAVDLQNLPAGLYSLTLETGGVVFARKVVNQ